MGNLTVEALTQRAKRAGPASSVPEDNPLSTLSVVDPYNSFQRCVDERGHTYVVTVRSWYDRGMPTGLHIERIGGDHFSRSYFPKEGLSEPELKYLATQFAQVLESLAAPQTFRSGIRALNRIASNPNLCERHDLPKDHKPSAAELDKAIPRALPGLFGRPLQERDWLRQLAAVHAKEVSIENVCLKSGQCLLLFSSRAELRSGSLTYEVLIEQERSGNLRAFLISSNGIPASKMANLLYGQFVCVMQRAPFGLMLESDSFNSLLAA